jgi:hypothetical protein
MSTPGSLLRNLNVHEKDLYINFIRKMETTGTQKIQQKLKYPKISSKWISHNVFQF